MLEPGQFIIDCVLLVTSFVWLLQVRVRIMKPKFISHIEQFDQGDHSFQFWFWFIWLFIVLVLLSEFEIFVVESIFVICVKFDRALFVDVVDILVDVVTVVFGVVFISLNWWK